VSEILVIKDYINETLEYKIISTWIIYKNLLRIFMKVVSAKYEPLDCAYTHKPTTIIINIQIIKLEIESTYFVKTYGPQGFQRNWNTNNLDHFVLLTN
jgi:hypothetical protein